MSSERPPSPESAPAEAQVIADQADARLHIVGQCFCGSLDHQPMTKACRDTPKCEWCGMCEAWHLRSPKRHKFEAQKPIPCDDCGQSVPVWYAPSYIWNAVMPTGVGMLCANCFIARAEAAGIVCTGWTLEPQNYVQQATEHSASASSPGTGKTAKSESGPSAQEAAAQREENQSSPLAAPSPAPAAEKCGCEFVTICNRAKGHKGQCYWESPQEAELVRLRRKLELIYESLCSCNICPDHPEFVTKPEFYNYTCEFHKEMGEIPELPASVRRRGAAEDNLRAEVERLTHLGEKAERENASLRRLYSETCDENEYLRAENASLRSALQLVRDTFKKHGINGDIDLMLLKAAEAALRGEEK